MKLALVYDRLNKLGGAESVLQAFAEVFPEADWFTSVWDIDRAPNSKAWRVHPSFLNRIPFFRTRHELIPYLMPFAFESFDLTKYDVVISIGSAECKGVITRPETLHLHYCLTPTRYLYSHQAQYLSNGLYRWVAHYLRRWDLVAAARPDVVISISEQVKKRVKKYYNRDSDVIYPPVDTKRFHDTVSPWHRDTAEYYLVVSRLVPYKNIDLIVDAFNESGKKLVIVGTGSELNKLRLRAKANVTFTGFVDDEEVASCYYGCKAHIQANEEDFGIAMVEALASGKPVIAFGKGGATEIVNSKTGVLYNELSAVALNSAIDSFETKKYTQEDCQKQAEKFDIQDWKKQISKRIMTEWQAHTKIYG